MRAISNLPIPLLHGYEKSTFVVNKHFTVSCSWLFAPLAIAFSVRIQELLEGLHHRRLDELSQCAIILSIERDVLKLRREASTVKADFVDR